MTVHEALDHPWLATEHPELTSRIPASRYNRIRKQIKEKYVRTPRRPLLFATLQSTIDIATNNSNHHNVYGAVIMTKVIARVHPVHLMNAD